jgi:uncharacterized membrane protein YbhN (UPF0104 family)
MPVPKQISVIKFACHLITIASVVFVVLYLVKLDLLALSIQEWRGGPLIYSLILLLIGCAFAVWNWKVLLGLNGYSITLWQSLYSTGLSVFGKYVPGKVWATVGRAGLVEAFGIPFRQAVLVAIHLQVLFILTGLLLGAAGLTASDRLWNIRVLIWLYAAVLILFFMVPAWKRALFSLLGKLLKKDLRPMHLGAGVLLRVLCLFLAQWFAWSFGFYFLARAFTENPVPTFSTALAFPLSVSLGVLSVISPGGIGVREGVMVGALGIAGVSLGDSMALSVLARIWFLVGEAVLFLGAILSKARLAPTGTE